MKICSKNLALILVISALFAWANENQSSSYSQMDRPLQDPAGTERLSFGVAVEKRLQYDTLSVQLSPGFSYAVTDRITFCDLPWPVLQMRIKSSNHGKTVSDGMDALSLSIKAGVTSTFLLSGISLRNNKAGYVDDYMRIFPVISALAKMPLSRFLWAQGDIMMQTVSDEAMQGYFYPWIGCQVASFFYATAGYRGGFFTFSDSYHPYSKISYIYRYSYSLDFYQSSNADKSNSGNTFYSSCIPVTIGIDLGRHFSTIVATSIGKKVGKFLPVEGQFQFMW